MKKIFWILFTAFLVTTSSAQIKMPAPSPTQVIRQDFALGFIELVYSRPSVKGRKVFGDLVPYGKLWRTGANNATIIKFSEAAEIGGKKIDSGSYALYTIPGEDSWQIILNRGIKNWGTENYRESDDVARFTVPVTGMKSSMETFTMQFADIMPESCALHIMWDKIAVAIPIRSFVKERIRQSLDSAMASGDKPYWNAAQYYREYENNNVKALENVKAAVAADPKAYYKWLYKARIEKDLDDKAAAKASSETSLRLSREAKSEDYIQMNEALLKKLK